MSSGWMWGEPNAIIMERWRSDVSDLSNRQATGRKLLRKRSL